MTPLLRVTLAFVAGLVPGLLAPAAAVTPALACACVAAALLLARRHSGFALLLFALLGLAAGAARATRVRESCVARWRAEERLVLAGSLDGEPVVGRATEATLHWRGCRAHLRVLLPRGAALPHAGEALRLEGAWLPADAVTRWPQPSLRLGSLRVTRVQRVSGRSALLPALRGRLQRTLRGLLPRTAGDAEALVLARREGLDPAVRDDYVAAGLAHLLAISGSHVLIFAGILLLLLRAAGVGWTATRVSALLLIGGYVLALGAVPPAARAALQFGLLMLGVLLQRPAHAWTSLAAAALALLALEPLYALDAGFQLSFAGVGGLLAWREPLARAAPRALPRWLRDGLAVGLAATLATAPIAALHFGQFAPVGLLATLVAGPLLTLALAALVLLLALAVIAPGLAPLLAPGTELLLRALRAVAHAAARVPGGHVPVASATVLLGLLLAGALLLAWRRERARAVRPAVAPVTWGGGRRLRVLRLSGALAAVLAVVAWAPQLLPTRPLELHAIDVGQGDALALRTPHGRWLLVDAGMRSDRIDMGRRRVVPYLLQHGVRRIDALLLTHAHADHIGGAAAVLQAFPVGLVVDPGEPAVSRQYLETLRAAAREPAEWIVPAPGQVLRVDGVTLEFLYPDRRLLDAPEDPNDFSLVFRLGFGRFGALFLGDAPRAVEDQLIATRRDELRATVLKVGHHGSAYSTGDSLLAAVDPRVALVSVGRDNRYGHPAPGVVARLLRQGATVLRTDEHGSIRVRAWRNGALELSVQR